MKTPTNQLFKELLRLELAGVSNVGDCCCPQLPHRDVMSRLPPPVTVGSAPEDSNEQSKGPTLNLSQQSHSTQVPLPVY